jgi:transposase-like protein
MPAKSRRETFWLEHIRKVELSGQSVTAYAKANKLDAQQIYNWRRKLRAEGKLDISVSTPQFAKVVRTETIAPRDRVALVVSVGPLRLHFDSLPDVSWLAQAVRALESSS